MKKKRFRISFGDPPRWKKVSGLSVEIPGFEGIKVFCYDDYIAGGWKFCEETTGALLHDTGKHFVTKDDGVKALSRAIAKIGKEKLLRRIELFWQAYPELKEKKNGNASTD